MMLYNLGSFIEIALPSAVLVYDDLSPASPEACVLIKDTGGTPSHDLDREDRPIQCLSFNYDKRAGLNALTSIYDLLKRQFHIILPAVTLDGVTYPAIEAWRILPMQTPTYIGTDENGKHLHSVNFIVTI